mmetsp:Transcript_12405/g.36539  ORF Transcript_12405/g.36539 Transcript_12405/m.36539 type:complete len:264 (+) Transcript_12405:3764-4555(+)
MISPSSDTSLLSFSIVWSRRVVPPAPGPAVSATWQPSSSLLMGAFNAPRESLLTDTEVSPECSSAKHVRAALVLLSSPSPHVSSSPEPIVSSTRDVSSLSPTRCSSSEPICPTALDLAPLLLNPCSPSATLLSSSVNVLTVSLTPLGVWWADAALGVLPSASPLPSSRPPSGLTGPPPCGCAPIDPLPFPPGLALPLRRWAPSAGLMGLLPCPPTIPLLSNEEGAAAPDGRAPPLRCRVSRRRLLGPAPFLPRLPSFPDRFIL